MGFPALPLAIAPRGHWHAAGEPATTAAATQLARAALPSAHHHATHRGGHRDRGGGGGGRGPSVAGRGGPKPAASSFGALCTLAGTVSRSTVDSQSAPLATSLPEKSPHSRPGRRRGEGGTGKAGSCPSFLPLKSKSPAPGGARAAAPSRLCCQPLCCGDRARRRTWASGAATPPGDTGRRRRPEQTIGGARPHLPLRLLGHWAAAGPRAWLALGRPLVVSRAGGCNAGRWAAAPSRLAVQSARPGAAATRRPRLNGPRPASGCRGDSIPVPPRIRRPGVVGSEGARGSAAADPGSDSCHVCQPATSERPPSN